MDVCCKHHCLAAEVTSQRSTVPAFLYPRLALTFPFWPLAAPPISLLPPTFCRCASFPALNFSWNQRCLLRFQIWAAKLLVAGNCHVILNPGGWNETSQVLLTQWLFKIQFSRRVPRRLQTISLSLQCCMVEFLTIWLHSARMLRYSLSLFPLSK